MNKFELDLLSKSYNQYLETSNPYFELALRNADEMLYYTEAAKQLSKEGYISAISDNIFSDSIDVVNDNILKFEILSKGIDYSKNL